MSENQQHLSRGDLTKAHLHRTRKEDSLMPYFSQLERKFLKTNSNNKKCAFEALEGQSWGTAHIKKRVLRREC
eukprot:5722259-Amphidinium_carterae.1